MAYYEVIFENGEHSVISGDDDSVLEGVKEQHRRAANGEPGGPAGIQAVRIKKVLKYDEHPASLYESQAVPAEVLKNWLDEAISSNQVGDLVSVPEVIASIRDSADPMVVTGPHESNFKMKEHKALDPKKWEAAA